MPRTREETEQAVLDAEAWLDQLEADGTPLQDAAPMRAITAALNTTIAAQHALEQAVVAGRKAGMSWTAVALALRTSRQSAHQRFAKVVGELGETE